MQLGKNIELIRRSWGLNQDEFGILLGATRGMISSYETKGIEPKISFLVRLYKLSGIEMTILCLDELDKDDIPNKPLAKPPARNSEIIKDTDFITRLEELEKLTEKLIELNKDKLS